MQTGRKERAAPAMRALIRFIEDSLIASFEDDADSFVASLDDDSVVIHTLEEQLRATGASRLVVDFRNLAYIEGTNLRDLCDWLSGLSRSKLVRFVGPGPALNRLSAMLVRPLPVEFSRTVGAALSCDTASFDPKTRSWRLFLEQFNPGHTPREVPDDSRLESDDRNKTVAEPSPDETETVIDLDEEAVYLRAEARGPHNPMHRTLEFQRGKDQDSADVGDTSGDV